MANNDNIHDLISSHSPQDELLKHTRKLVEKWEPTGLLEGIKSETEVSSMSVLLENQATQLMKEASETSTAANKEEWSGVALPLVRRIFGELAAQDLVSVQPMNLPSGLIFYLDFKYGSAQTSLHEQNSDIFGNTSRSLAEATGGLYGAGKFGYSINDKSTSTLVGATSAQATNPPTATTYATASANLADVDFEPALSASVAAGSIIKVFVNGADLERDDKDGVRAFEVSGSDITAFYPQYSKYESSTDRYVFLVAGSGFATAKGIGIKYHEAPVASNRGDFEDNPVSEPTATDVGIPQVDIQMRSIPIVAKTRKLKAVWTPELAQDLNAYHSVDAEAELTSMLSEYISMEIDLEILDMLIANASAKKEYWSAKVGFEYDGAGGTEHDFVQIGGSANAYTKGEWFQTLGIKIQSVSNSIHQKTLRGGANFIVVSPETATVLESIPGYAAATDGDAMNNKYAMGVQKVGAINNRYTVYKNPYMMGNEILVGFRGSNFLETGAVYAPYIPLIMTPLVYDPVNFTPRKGVMTRYAKKMIRPEFYGKVILSHMNTV